jgi:hypothetical protein
MKKMLFCLLTLIVFVGQAQISFANDAHPEKMGKKKCIECHKEATPNVVKQWENSAHGFTGVGCGICHGDEGNFKAKPDKEACRSCHASSVDNNLKKETACFTCHPAHYFNVHKISDYKEKK